MKNIILFFCCLCVSLSSTYADDFGNFLNANYEGGSKAFAKTIMMAINYPLEARENGITGELKARLYLDKEGKIQKMEYLNKLGYGIEEEVTQVVHLTEGKWTASETERIFDFSIAFLFEEKKNMEADLIVIAHGSPSHTYNPPVFESPYNGTFKTNKQLEKAYIRQIKKPNFKQAKAICEELLIRVPDSDKYKTWYEEIQKYTND